MVVCILRPDTKQQKQADRQNTCDHISQCAPTDLRHGCNHTAAHPDDFAVEVDGADGQCPGAGNEAETGIGWNGEERDGQDYHTSHQREGIFSQKDTDP